MLDDDNEEEEEEDNDDESSTMRLLFQLLLTTLPLSLSLDSQISPRLSSILHQSYLHSIILRLRVVSLCQAPVATPSNRFSQSILLLSLTPRPILGPRPLVAISLNDEFSMSE